MNTVAPEASTVSELKDLHNVILESKPVKRVSIAVQNLYAVLKSQFPNGFTYDNLMEIVIFAMRHLSLFNKDVSGQQKKKIIIDSLILILDTTDSGENEKYDPIVREMIPTVIDTLSDVEKAKIKINKKLRKCCWCC